MIQEVTLPEISENVESGNVISIQVSQGDSVAEGDTLLEIETDKASVEVPSTAGGTVQEILVSEGDDVKVGAVIAKIETQGGGVGSADEAKSEKPAAEEEPESEEISSEGEAPSEESAAEARGGEAAASRVEAAAAESTAEPQESAGEATPSAGAGPAIPKSAGGKVPAAPSTRRLAREIGVDITEVSGTGPGGRVTADDVKRYSRESRGAGGGRPAGAGVAGATGGQGMAGAFSLPDFSKWGETHREKLSNVRRITGENTQAAWQTIPHVTQFDEADVTDLEAFRQSFSKLADKRGVKLTVTSILMKVVARALKKFPRVNSSLDAQAGEIVYKDFVNISVAADTDRGLLVPVVRDVDKKSILTLSGELGDLAQRARNKQIKPAEMEGGTFTISNLGGIGGTGFTPVVFPPQVAIMGVARSQTKPVWRDGEFVPRLILPLSLSYDHRVIDGADGARFLRWICQSLEQPLYMELEGDNDE